MNREVFNFGSDSRRSDDSAWDFSDEKYQQKGEEVIGEMADGDDEMMAEINPYIDKIDPKMLKRVIDGWKDRRYRYRKLFREEESVAELSDAECNAWADLFYLGTVFRDYLDSILGLKSPGKSGFRLIDSTEEDAKKMDGSNGWFNTEEHLISIIGDKFNNKFEYLGAIAHEMWHAYQTQAAEEGNSDRSDIYFKAFYDYVGIEDPDQNREQLLEKEAYIFQHLFEQKLLEATEDAPEIKEILLEEEDDDIALGFEEFMELAEQVWTHGVHDDMEDLDFDDDY